MSLISDVYVNHTPIGHVVITRVTNTETGLLDDDTVSSYSYRVSDNRSGVIHQGHVDHRYGDGAFELLAKVYINVSHEQNGWG